MFLLGNIENSKHTFKDIKQALLNKGEELGMEIWIQKKEIFETLKATTAELENSSQEPTEDIINDTAQTVNINTDEIKETINDVDELLDIMDYITEGKQIKKPVN